MFNPVSWEPTCDHGLANDQRHQSQHHHHAHGGRLLKLRTSTQEGAERRKGCSLAHVWRAGGEQPWPVPLVLLPPPGLALPLHSSSPPLGGIALQARMPLTHSPYLADVALQAQRVQHRGHHQQHHRPPVLPHQIEPPLPPAADAADAATKPTIAAGAGDAAGADAGCDSAAAAAAAVCCWEALVDHHARHVRQESQAPAQRAVQQQDEGRLGQNLQRLSEGT